MLRVGLTGGLACGKSVVAKMMVARGAHVIEADAIARDLMRPGQPVFEAVVKHFGREIVNQDGEIDRAALAKIAFQGGRIVELNQLVHPAVVQRQRDWLNEMEARDPGGISIVDATLMIEVGTYKNYDKVIVVTCRPEIQKQRLRTRSGLSEEEIEARVRSQMPLEEKVKYADFVIDNSGDLPDTRRQVEQVNSKLRAA